MKNYLKHNLAKSKIKRTSLIEYFSDKQYISAVVIVTLASIFIALFLFDIGINSKNFIKRDFSKAFIARQTGNCEEFRNQQLAEREEWFQRCIRERQREGTVPIKKFSIKEITVNGGEAFLLVELARDNVGAYGEHEYVVNYQMKRERGRWYIDQKINN